MTTTAELRPLVREMIAMHEALRKLGVSASDIQVLDLVVPGHPGDTIGFAVDLGGCYCELPIGRLGPTETFEAFMESEWSQAVDGVNNGVFTDEDLMANYQASEVYRQRDKFLAFLFMHGFRFRRPVPPGASM